MKIFSELGTNKTFMPADDANPDKAIWREMERLLPDPTSICAELPDEQDPDYGVKGVWVSFTPPIVWENGLAFMEEFTPDELVMVFTLAQTQIDTNIWITTMAAASSFTNQDQRTLDGMAYLVFKGLITQARYNTIMGV